MKDEAIVALYWQRNESAITETQQKYPAHYKLDQREESRAAPAHLRRLEM